MANGLAVPHRSAAPPAGVLGQLSVMSAGQGLPGLAERLGELAAMTRDDVMACEESLATLDGGASAVARSAGHLLALRGKRLRPLCVALAARLGTGFSPAARELAVAVELVHGATLLHDDVVDLGTSRRGVPAARVLFGNAASIFAGDWLLIEALRRVRRARLPGVLSRLFDVIEEMIFAESEQLEAKGQLVTDRVGYFRVAQGKTAALFRWALWAGGRAGGLNVDACRALEEYGRQLGIAFQLIDDVLDLRGDAALTGKGLLADVRDGKMTFPLIVALERRPTIAALVAEAAERPEAEAELVGAVAATGALETAVELARDHAAEAHRALGALPAGRARGALETVAEAAVARDR